MKKLLLALVFCVVATSLLAADKKYELKIPANVTSNNDRLAYAYRVKEKLRLLHNEMGREVKNGNITIEEFEEWKLKNYYPQESAVNNEIIKYRWEVRNSTQYSIDLENCFEDKNTTIILNP